MDVSFQLYSTVVEEGVAEYAVLGKSERYGEMVDVLLKNESVA